MFVTSMTRKRPPYKTAIAIVVFLIAAFTSPFLAQASKADDFNPFVGAWELVAFESRNEEGHWMPMPLSGDAKWVGSILYSASGMTSAQIYTSDRQSVSYSRSLVNGYMAYYGSYEVDFDNKHVTHRRQGHINPERNRQVAIRSFRFDGDLMYLTPLEDTRASRLTWKRIE